MLIFVHPEVLYCTVLYMITLALLYRNLVERGGGEYLRREADECGISFLFSRAAAFMADFLSIETLTLFNFLPLSLLPPETLYS